MHLNQGFENIRDKRWASWIGLLRPRPVW